MRKYLKLSLNKRKCVEKGGILPSNIGKFLEGFVIQFDQFIDCWDRNQDEMVFCYFCHGYIFLEQI